MSQGPFAALLFWVVYSGKKKTFLIYLLFLDNDFFSWYFTYSFLFPLEVRKRKQSAFIKWISFKCFHLSLFLHWIYSALLIAPSICVYIPAFLPYLCFTVTFQSSFPLLLLCVAFFQLSFIIHILLLPWNSSNRPLSPSYH